MNGESEQTNLEKYAEKIKTQLGIDNETETKIITELFGRYVIIAQSICNRTDDPQEMYAILTDVIAGAYNQRGGEGFTSSSIGGQSYHHQDLYNILQNRLVNAGLRIGKF